jgi:hypothetical protein
LERVGNNAFMHHSVLVSFAFSLADVCVCGIRRRVLSTFSCAVTTVTQARECRQGAREPRERAKNSGVN